MKSAQLLLFFVLGLGLCSCNKMSQEEYNELKYRLIQDVKSEVVNQLKPNVTPNCSPASITKRDFKINDCVEFISKLINQNYIYEGRLRGSYSFSENMMINSDNAEYFLTVMLDQNKYTRIPFDSKLGNTFGIVHKKEALDSGSVKAFSASINSEPNIPKLFDIYELTYEPVDPRIIIYMGYQIRHLFSKYSSYHVVPHEPKIVIRDVGPKLMEIYKVLLEIDKLPKEEQERLIEVTLKYNSSKRKRRRSIPFMDFIKQNTPK